MTTTTSPDLDRYFARTGVDPLTGAFDAPELPRHRAEKKPEPPATPPEVDPVAAMKAAMPAHAIRIFDALQAAKDDPAARAAIEATLPPHALRALASLEKAIAEQKEKNRPRTGPGIGVSPSALAWREVVATTARPQAANRPVAVYAHFPFCAARCVFCPFYRYADPADWRPYRDALLCEIDLAAAPLAGLPDRPPVQAVYFGGGTPGDLPAEALAAAILRIRQKFPVTADAEITVEGRPSTFDAEKIAACRAAGATRFSLGVQTFDGDVRRAMGRRLDAGPLLDRLREIGAAAGEAPVIVDLIYGLPGQTDAGWEHDLETAIAEQSVAGLDLYRLKVFPGSPLARLAEAGRAAPADEAVMARRFARGVERLRIAGWRRLSRWHWARPGARERSVYNRLAKGAGDIVPLGCGAGGRWGGHGFVNTPGLDAWFAAVKAGEKNCLGRSATPDAAWEEILSAQIEACVLVPAAWSGVSAAALASAERLFVQWSEAGLLEKPAAGDSSGGGERWSLTVAGQYWSDRLLHALQAVLGQPDRA
ncbi:radical SAM protein [Opitutaceae bacterium TAV5]|nr:radical SAM protein [Opitutaceae bacterium TAV5]